jgi:DNA-binding transcriptional regulator YdaS (Cro superfamily)
MQLREYLDAMDLKVVAFAEKLGVSDPTVYRWISKERVPEPDMMRRIHQATHGMVQPNDWVLEGQA